MAPTKDANGRQKSLPDIEHAKRFLQWVREWREKNVIPPRGTTQQEPRSQPGPRP